MLCSPSNGSNHPDEVFSMSCPRVRLYFALVVSIVAGLALRRLRTVHESASALPKAPSADSRDESAFLAGTQGTQG